MMIHETDIKDSLSADSPAKQRVAFEELVQEHVALLHSNAPGGGGLEHDIASASSFSIPCSGALAVQLVSKLPFKLTNCQRNAMGEILIDLQRPERMVRLVQGDVVISNHNL
jgi:ATP-dependent DNA helicase RecG